MFWNNEFLNATPSVFDTLLQSGTTKLSDILFHEDLLQELKTSNLELTNYLARPEIVDELVNNITSLTEEDCYDKSLYSKVHAAYISCEILTAGSNDITDALLSQSNYLTRIISCLVGRQEQETQPSPPPPPSPPPTSNPPSTPPPTETISTTETETTTEKSTETSTETEIPTETETPTPTETPKETPTETPKETPTETPKETPTETPPQTESGTETSTTAPNITTTTSSTPTTTTVTTTTPPIESIRVVPQKAALVSKLISNIHSGAPADLSCPITKNIETFSSLVQVLVNNIDVSGSFEILSTFISRTNPPELRYVFCEILSKLNFVSSLINVMTLSNVDDKQRNACQLLCDIIVIGRQEANEHLSNDGPAAQDMLAESIESREAVHQMLKQMFPHELTITQQTQNKTAIVCGMKVLQTLVERKHLKSDANLVARTIEQIQDEIAESLIYFHELLLNPPKQEPIKTTFGVIQKPLGYIRLEVVNLIRELLSTGSSIIIKKLVELKTFKIIIDLFVEYPWNNLLHTQVEQAVHLIIKNCRRDEDLKYQVDMQQHSSNNVVEPINDLPSLALLSQLLNECDIICRLLSPHRIGEQANFGHIIQMINSISISCDLDTIKDHLNEMKDKRPELYASWTNFVNVDVASFKAISLYFDVQSVSKHTENNWNLSSNDDRHIYQGYPNSSNNYAAASNGDDQIMTYFSFTKETILPSINVDVLPNSRRSAATNNY